MRTYTVDYYDDNKGEHVIKDFGTDRSGARTYARRKSEGSDFYVYVIVMSERPGKLPTSVGAFGYSNGYLDTNEGDTSDKEPVQQAA